MKKLFFISVLFLNLLSCTCSQKPKDENKVFSEMRDDLLKRNNYVIPDSLFSFFPDESGKYDYLELYGIFSNAEKSELPLNLLKFSMVKLIEVYQSDNKEFLQQLIDNYRSQSFFSTKSEYNDYFVIGSERELSKKYDTLELKERYSNLDNERLLFYLGDTFDNTNFLYDTTTIMGFPMGYEVLLLKKGCNFVLPKDYLYDWSVLPDNLKHGYRSGIAFKEEDSYIIYWAIAW